MLQVSELYIYPIKSLPGIQVKETRVTEKGFEHDRCWMLIDANNRFLSQREIPLMTQLQVSIIDNGLLVKHKTKEGALYIPFIISPDGGRVMVSIWDDCCEAVFVSEEADKWFTATLNIDCRLVYMPDNTRRFVDENYVLDNNITSFSDAYPFLIIGQASLDDLNDRLTEALPINRFRPNIVFTGGCPYEEDRIGSFIIGNVNFFGVKLCARCIITTIDQGSASQGKEPLKTLASYRSKNNKIYFGQNLLHKGEGIVAAGDELQVLSLHYEERFIVDQKLKING